MYWPLAAESLQQPFMVPEETMQRTQSLNHKQAIVGSSEMTSGDLGSSEGHRSEQCAPNPTTDP